MRPTFDERDAEILRAREAAFNRVAGPRVGDFLKTPAGYLRFTYEWEDAIQTTDRPSESGESGSFYLGNGYASYSGSLDSGVPKTEIVPTSEVKSGRFWFFHHDWQQAHNGVDFTLPCRVFQRVQTGELCAGGA